MMRLLSSRPAWTIIQDTGDGFFGTEVPTATISTSAALSIRADTDGTFTEVLTGAAATRIMLDAQVACYSLPAADLAQTPSQLTDPAPGTPNTSVTPGTAPYTGGVFDQAKCGLIPERHDNSRMLSGAMKGMLSIVDPTTATDGTTDPLGSATPRAHAVARYDAGDESMVYVWLATGMDMDDTKPSQQRMIDVAVKCADGEVMMDADADGNPMPIKVPAPDMITMITMITMIDPNGDDLADYTDMCSGDRGALQITMPDGSTAGMVFTHITQMMGHYRMNFPGYSMANPATCWSMTAAAGDADGDGAVNAPEVAVDVNGDGAMDGEDIPLLE